MKKHAGSIGRRKATRRQNAEMHDTVVSHLVGDNPGIGWVFSIEGMARQAIDARVPWRPEIADLFDRKQDIRPFLAEALVKATHRAAQEACEAILAMGLDDEHPVSAIVAKAMEVVHLGWQAEILQARDSSYFLQPTIQKRGGKASAEARRIRARSQLDELAQAYMKLHADRKRRGSWKPIRLADIAAVLDTTPKQLRSAGRTLKEIERRAGKLAQE